MSFKFTYGGKDYWGDGTPVIQPISEFNTGIRQGVASNDDRNLASFFSFEDARGGIGVRVGEVREDKDKLADSDGLIFQKMNQLIKPPLMSTRAMAGATKTKATFAHIKELLVDATIRMFVGFGDQLWYSDGTTAAVVQTTADPFTTGPVTSILTYAEPVAGTKRGYVGTSDNEDIVYFTDPTAGGPGPFTAITGVKGEALFVYDGKLWAFHRGVLKWSITPTTTPWDPVSAIGAWPNRAKFIGIFPYGQTAYPYFLCEYDDPARSYIGVFDLDNYRVVPVFQGTTGGILDAWMAGPSIGVVLDRGRGAMMVTPNQFGAPGTQDINWRAIDRDGFLAARDGVAVGGVTSPAGALLFSNMDDTTEAQMFLHKGTGWMPYGKTVAGDVICGGAYIPHLQTLVMPVKPAGVDLQLNTIPWWNEAFIPGQDQSVLIETGNLAAITPWFSFGFNNLVGAMLALQHGGYADTNNKILVEYQQDFDESAWINLGTFPNENLPTQPEVKGRGEPVANASTLLFNIMSGVAFTWMRMRFTLISLDANQSPNAFPMTARFFKRPKLRNSFRINLDIQTTIDNRQDINTPDEILNELRATYDSPIVPQLVLGPINTWALIMQFPAVLVLDPETERNDDVVPTEVSQGAVITLNFGEMI